MSRRILTTLLAVAYAAIVLPGHAGLHALSGIEHCQHGSHADALSSSDSTTASCSGHNHDHHGDHQHGSKNDSSKSPVNSPHDHSDDCEICQWFSQGQVLIESTSIEVVDSLITVQSVFKVNPFEKPVFSNADPRGPPAVA